MDKDWLEVKKTGRGIYQDHLKIPAKLFFKKMFSWYSIKEIWKKISNRKDFILVVNPYGWIEATRKYNVTPEINEQKVIPISPKVFSSNSWIHG